MLHISEAFIAPLDNLQGGIMGHNDRCHCKTNKKPCIDSLVRGLGTPLVSRSNKLIGIITKLAIPEKNPDIYLSIFAYYRWIRLTMTNIEDNLGLNEDKTKKVVKRKIGKQVRFANEVEVREFETDKEIKYFSSLQESKKRKWEDSEDIEMSDDLKDTIVVASDTELSDDMKHFDPFEAKTNAVQQKQQRKKRKKKNW